MPAVLGTGFPVVLSADLRIDAVGDDSDDDDSDDGNNGDFEEVTVEPFVQVARGREQLFEIGFSIDIASFNIVRIIIAVDADQQRLRAFDGIV